MLLQNNYLCLDVAYLFRDDPFSDFLQNGQFLLDKFDLDCLALRLDLLNYNCLIIVPAIEVILPIKIVEALERRNAVPVVERDGIAPASLQRQGRGIAQHQGLLSSIRQGFGDRGQGQKAGDEKNVGCGKHGSKLSVILK